MPQYPSNTFNAEKMSQAVCLSSYDGEAEEAALKHPDCLQAQGPPGGGGPGPKLLTESSERRLAILGQVRVVQATEMTDEPFQQFESGS